MDEETNEQADLRQIVVQVLEGYHIENGDPEFQNQIADKIVEAIVEWIR